MNQRVLDNRYELQELIGGGGMADVYKAQDHKLNRLVAVKVMKAEFREGGSGGSQTFPSQYCQYI